MWHWSLLSLSTRTTPLPQLPPSCQTSTNGIRINYRVHAAERKILNSSKHPSVPRLSFCPYIIQSSEQPGVSGGDSAIRPHGQAPHLWMKLLVFSKCKIGDHGWVPLFFLTKPLGEWVHCISSIQCWYIWFPSRTDQTLNNIEQAECVAKILAMKSFHSQLIS